MIGLRSKYKGVEVHKIITTIMCCGERIERGRTMYCIDHFCVLELRRGLLGVRLRLSHEGKVIFTDNYYSMGAVHRKFLR